MPPFVSASVVVVVHEQLLTVLDPIRREAVLPGGHLRWEEHPRLGAAREVREETGFEVVAGALVGVYAGRDLAGESGIVRVVYTGQIVGGSIRSSREGKAAWLSAYDYSTSTARDAPIVADWLNSTATYRPAP